MSTLAQLRSAVSSKIGLDNTAASAEQTLIDKWVNEGVLDVLLETRCKARSQTITPGAADDYTLDTSASWTGVLALITIRDTDNNPVEQVSVDQLLELRRAGTSTGSDVTHYALAGHDLILFYPQPGASDQFTLYYTPVPKALSASADDPASVSVGVPAEFHKAIEWYALAEAADYDEDTSAAQGERYRALYREELGRIMAALKRRGGYKLPAARFPTRRRRRISRFNDTDWRG